MSLLLVDPRILGDEVRRLRTAAGRSQQQLALAAGVREITVGRIERGEHLANLPTLLSVARALGTTVDALCAPAVINDPAAAASAAGDEGPATSVAGADTGAVGSTTRGEQPPAGPHTPSLPGSTPGPATTPPATAVREDARPGDLTSGHEQHRAG